MSPKKIGLNISIFSNYSIDIYFGYFPL